MGWSTYHRPAGQTDREHFQGEIREGLTILDSSTKGNVFYAACKDEQTGEVFALVYLIQRTPRDYYNFGVKAMDETVGPCYYDCPAHILDLLTETQSEYAKSWRESCRKALATKAAAKTSTASVKHGSKIKVAQPLKFGNGLEAQEFELIIRGRTRRWMANPGTDNRFLCRLPRDWATLYSWEKISA